MTTKFDGYYLSKEIAGAVARDFDVPLGHIGSAEASCGILYYVFRRELWPGELCEAGVHNYPGIRRTNENRKLKTAL